MTPGQIALAAAVVLLGATVQRAIGLGLGLVTVPVLALLVPERMPQTLLLLALPLLAGLAWHERSALRSGGIGWVLVGRVAGAWAGGPMIAGLGPRALQAVFGTATLVAVALLSIPRVTVPLTRTTQLAAGTASGVMGTVSAMAGPPLALLYADLDAARLRATVSLIFLVGNVVGIVSLGVSGRLTLADFALAGGLLLPLAIGYGIGARLAGRLPPGTVRPIVIGLAGFGAVVLLTRAALGVAPS